MQGKRFLKAGEKMNLIPKQSEKSLSYWCSWYTQNIVAMMDNVNKFPPEIAAAMKTGENGAMVAPTL
jgi:hypothetical protein